MRKVADILRNAGLVAVLTLAAPLTTAVAAHAQGLPAIMAAKATPGKPGEKLLVEADELIYDNDKSTVTARGNAELHYGPRTLQADRVRYDRASSRVFAEGNVRLTEADGAVVTGERMELTDDFKTGFVDAFRGQQTVVRKLDTVRTRFTAPRAERVNGDQTTFEYGTYTACEPCKDNPKSRRCGRSVRRRSSTTTRRTRSISRTRRWRSPASRSPTCPISRPRPDGEAQDRVPDAALRHLDRARQRRVATLLHQPRSDLRPDPDSDGAQPARRARAGRVPAADRQRLLLVAPVRHLATTPSAFLPSPLGAGNRDFRGSIETQGRFYINERWRTGWDIVGVTDKWFLDNYRIRNQSVTTDYFREAVSTAYLIGQGDRSWFEARGYYFKGLSSFDWQKQQPVVAR